MMRSALLFLAASVVLVAPARAIPILIDPGAVGHTSSDISVPFDDLNGTPLDGREIVLDFVFDDMKHVEVIDPGFSIEARVIFESDSPHALTLPGFPSVGFDGFFLSDENGSALPVRAFGAVMSLPEEGLYSVSIAFRPSAVTFHDVHMTWLLPMDAEFQITGATFALSRSLYEIGEWGAVPEPSILFLLGTGLLGLVGYARRHHA